MAVESAFAQDGLKAVLKRLRSEIAELYLSDEIPWVVGYSGGKDSTATLQLVWLALAELEPEQLRKPVYVISTDTLVENPIVAAWVKRSLEHMHTKAAEAGLPLTTHRLTPEVQDTFWVNLIGRGYPAPRPKFRWCTNRLKISPSNSFISEVVRKNGEAILVLGMRRAESHARAKVMDRLEKRRVRDRLSPNANLQNSFVYTPVEDWTNDDVWTFLMQVPNPWGFNNRDLLTMYQGASADGECPLVIDSTTPSCGDSRFGCWVCTLVDRDKSMTAMIQNDQEKEWMLPLLKLRNELDGDDRELRDFRRMNGSVQLYKDRVIPGPYLQASRERWLRKVLDAQEHIRIHGPPEMAELDLISPAELAEIRRLWVVEKHELEDSLPQIVEAATGAPYAGPSLDDNLVLGAGEMGVLRELCGEDDLHYQLVRELLDVERQHRSMARRAGLFKSLDQALQRGFYDDAADAETRARARRDILDETRKQAFEVRSSLLHELEDEHEDLTP